MLGLKLNHVIKRGHKKSIRDYIPDEEISCNYLSMQWYKLNHVIKIDPKYGYRLSVGPLLQKRWQKITHVMDVGRWIASQGDWLLFVYPVSDMGPFCMDAETKRPPFARQHFQMHFF